MELRHLRYFVAVAEELHFGRAARRLHISQPPLSAQIRDLEHEVGAALFERSHHKVELTDVGRALVVRANDVLARVAAFRDEAAAIARGEHGLVTVGYTATATYQLLSPLVARLQEHRVALRLVQMPSPAQPLALADASIDVGLACLPVALDDSVAVPLVHEAITVAIPAGHRLARRRRVVLADLRGEPQVGLRDSTEPGWAQACFAELLRGRASGPIVATADSKLALLGLVAAGLGVAVISSSLATLVRGGIVYRPLADARGSLVLGALHRSTPSALVNRVVELAVASARSIRSPRRAG